MCHYVESMRVCQKRMVKKILFDCGPSIWSVAYTQKTWHAHHV